MEGRGRTVVRLHIAAVLMMLAGCQTTRQKFTLLVPESHPDRVVAMLGRPDGISIFGNFEVYTYRSRRILGSTSRKTFAAVFEYGKLTAFGPGEAQMIAPDDVEVAPPSRSKSIGLSSNDGAESSERDKAG